MTRVIEKWHGAGNDFVVVDGRALLDTIEPLDWTEWTRAACDRRRGVGADGVLVLEADPELDFRMHYRNADGGEAEMCGNGGRVLAAYAHTRGLGRDGELVFRSRWGEHRAAVRPRSEHHFEVSLTLPDVPAAGGIDVDSPWGGRAAALRVSCGVPHLVLDRAATPARTLADVPLEQWGPPLRRLKALGPEGANVDVLERGADGGLALRTFERGVEGETLACGTGATAAAAAAVRWGWSGSPVRLRVASGDVLEVSFREEQGALREVVLRGPAVRVFRADLAASIVE